MSMIKYCENPAHDRAGNPTVVNLMSPGLTKTASYDNFGDEIREYISSIKPKDGYAYLLIAAMGDQNWGPNRNGDYWPTEALKNPGHNYGHKTYEVNGNWYHHHQNKDPNLSYGRVLKSVWNDDMGRIELIVEVDLNKDDKTRNALANKDTIETSMGCFRAGTKILLASMINKPIESVREGEEVIGHDGERHVVNGTNNYTYKGDMCRLVATSKEEIYCTADHPFYAVSKANLKPREKPSIKHAAWVKAKDLRRNDYLMLPIVTDVREPEYVDKWFAKLAGYYLAEGHLIKGKSSKRRFRGIHLTCNIDDACPREIEEICSNLKRSPSPYMYRTERSPKTVGIEIYDEDLANKMYDLCGSYAKEKYLDRSVFYWSHENLKWFLGAYIDGDGSVGTSKWQEGSISISTASETLSYQLPMLLAKLGIISSVNTCIQQPSKIVRRVTTEKIVYIGKTHSHVLLGYSDKLSRGYVKPQNSHIESWIDDRYMYVRVKESTIIGDQEVQVYNLDVDGSDTFVANLSAVHNSKVRYDICKICHPNWRIFYSIPEDDMIAMSKELDLNKVHEIGKKHGVDLSYITKMNPDGGPVGIHSNMNKYCDHMKFSRNQILSTGEQVCVINLRPSFFDISFVSVNADKSSFVLAKVAAEKDAYKNENINDDAVKVADQVDSPGDGEINKDIPDGKVIADEFDDIKRYYLDNICPAMYEREAEIPDEIIDEVAQKHDLASIMSSFMAMGMFPHPREFQRIVMIQMGKKDELGAADRAGDYLCHGDIPSIDPEQALSEDVIGMAPDKVNPGIMSALKDFFWDRSGYRQPVARRMVIIKKADERNQYLMPQDNHHRQRAIAPALLASMGALYAANAIEGKKKLPDILRDAKELKSNKALAITLGSAIAGAIILNRLMQPKKYDPLFDAPHGEKRAAATPWSAAKWVGPTLGAFLWGGHVINKAQQGRPVNKVERFVAQNPVPTSIGATVLVNKPQIIPAALKGVDAFRKYLVKGAEMGVDQSMINIDEYPLEQRDALGIALWEHVNGIA